MFASVGVGVGVGGGVCRGLGSSWSSVLSSGVLEGGGEGDRDGSGLGSGVSLGSGGRVGGGLTLVGLWFAGLVIGASWLGQKRRLEKSLRLLIVSVPGSVRRSRVSSSFPSRRGVASTTVSTTVVGVGVGASVAVSALVPVPCSAILLISVVVVLLLLLLVLLVGVVFFKVPLPLSGTRDGETLHHLHHEAHHRRIGDHCSHRVEAWCSSWSSIAPCSSRSESGKVFVREVQKGA
mmetsp:Transcript_18571/g.30916  ORF Transcript_18571/g.30916 Transcript_18571/m.30916 type:complete len:235 (+) Transcript_18571:44-748(+)